MQSRPLKILVPDPRDLAALRELSNATLLLIVAQGVPAPAVLAVLIERGFTVGERN